MPKTFKARSNARDNNAVLKSKGYGASSLHSDAKATRSLLNYVYNFLKPTVLAVGTMFLASQAHAQTVIYQDDFESGVTTGWSDNSIENAPMIGTNFLGRFGGPTPQVSRTFTVPAGATALEIEFDLLRFDSWDFFGPGNDDGFSVLIDGNPLFSTNAPFGTFPYLDFPGGQGARYL